MENINNPPRESTANSPSATCLTEFITTRPLFMRPSIEEAPSAPSPLPPPSLVGHGSYLMQHAARIEL